MSVYVDQLLPWGKSKTWKYPRSCHLIADTEEELDTFAATIGLDPKWKQKKGLVHYDLTEGKRKQALRNGAQEIDVRDLLKLAWGKNSA